MEEGSDRASERTRRSAESIGSRIQRRIESFSAARTQLQRIRTKTGKRFSPALVQQAIGDLRSNGLLSDERFAEALIHARSGKGYGPRYIAQELAQKGIAKELSGELLDERDPQWMARATEVALKKLRTTPRLAEAFRKLDDEDASLVDARERQQQRFQANRSCHRS